ncbi:MAG: sigma-70 family RNA polymerase sigma factor [Verrucomicrobiota bacterium]|nr:sigma-70 family RNA polymerase sigma factor [Verrucomicrobiota bacterium]
MLQPSAQQIEDSAVIARVAQGERAAFPLLYDRLSRPLFSLALKMLRDQADAEDLLQDVFVQIWKRAPSYDPRQSSVFSWAVLLTRSRAIDRLRSRMRRSQVIVPSLEGDEAETTLPDASTGGSGSDIIEKKDEAARVRAALQNLPQEQREAIELAFLSGLTHHEIAERLEQPLGTVKARIRRGLLRLRQKFPE